MLNTITTKPGKKYASIKNPRVYEALRRQGMSKQRAARISNARAHKDAGPPLAGPGGLLGTPGMGGGRKWGNRRKDKACTCGVATKESLGPGITRIRGNLCNVHGRYGPCDASLSKKPKGGKGRKPKATPAPERDRNQERMDRRDQVLADMGIDPGASEALTMLRNGEQPQPEALARAGAIEAGLVEQAADGSYRMTPSGRALIAAAEAGDPGRAGDIISAARDRKAARTARERAAAQKKLDAAAKRVAAGEKKPPTGGGGKKGGGSSSSAPQADSADRIATHQQREQERQETRKKREEERLADRATREAERQADRAQRQRERQEDRQAQLDERRARAAERRTPGRIVSNRVPIQSPRRGRRPNAVRAKAYTPTRTMSSGHTGVLVALYPDDAAAQVIAGADGATEPIEQLHLTLCFLGDSTEQPLATNKDKVIAAVEQWAQQHGQPMKGVVNGLGRFFHSEGDDTNAVYVTPDVPGLPEQRQSLAEWIEASGFDYSHDHGFTPHITVAYVPLDAPTPPIHVEMPITFDHVTLAWGDEHYDFPLGMRTKSFAVFKDDTDAWRWVARTTTAYRDRDGEIITTKALDADAARMTTSGQYGPLRYWHIGLPDPFNPAAPWGPGLDIGTCDYSAFIGRTSIESGTFTNHAIGKAFADSAADYELSPGFFHPPDLPNAAGEYTAIRRFERSVVPTQYGRASNLFTGLTVKEHRMDDATYKARVEAFLKDMNAKGVPEQVAAGALAGMQQADKSAEQQGIAFKSDQSHVELVAPGTLVYTAPDGTQGLIVDGRFIALKSAEPTTKADMPAAEMVEAGATELEDGETEEAAEAAEYVGDMAPGAFRALLIDAFSEAITQFGSGISGKMSEMDDALKAMGYARMKSEQDAKSTAVEVAQLKARLAQLEGDQPAIVDPSDIAAALKGAPQPPPDPTATPIPEGATPVQALAMRTMPALYQTNGQGGFAGWTPPAPS